MDAVLPEAVRGYDLHLLGSWSDNGGRTPAEMKALIAALVAAIGMPPRVAVFGTGETQWGAEFYCGAVRRMARFFGSALPRLEIEQMPHGQRDSQAVAQWLDQVLETLERENHANLARHHA